jgi:RES domain-containing protein
MREAWRIVKERHAATAFTGEGAAKTGGRWNSRGVAVVYTSSSKSLATLESLVHLNPPLTFKSPAAAELLDDRGERLGIARGSPIESR